MILLPDMNIGGHILSIQDPYLLDGYVITDIERNMSYNIFSRIIIKNENNQCITIEEDELIYIFRREMYDFISMYGRNAFVLGRTIDDWTGYTIDKYLADMHRQCSDCNRFSVGYIDDLKIKLRRQGREYFEPSRLNYRELYDLRRTYSTRLVEPTPISPVPIERQIDWSFLNGIVPDDYSILPNNCNDISTTSEKTKIEYIHSNNYKPEYIHYYMPDEDKTTTLLLGAEIEVDCGGKSEEHAKQVLEIMCGIEEENGHALETKMYCMRDGSLTNGLEFATMPCSLEYHKKEMDYKKMFKYLDENGYKAHDTTTCGLHIHANRSYLGKTELVQQLTISKILYILEKFNEEICVIARRDNRYSKFVGSGKNETSIVELYGKYKDKDKYVALNMKHKDTIEFRCFKGTLKYETFILTLEFVKDIIDYAKSINIEEIELIKWSDLMNTFSDELKNYYNERLEKENAKKEEKEKLNDKYVIRFTDDSEITCDNISNSFNYYINERPAPMSYCLDEPALQHRYSSLFGRPLIDCSSRVIVNLNNNTQQPERTLLEDLKDKEKTLKKRINNSNNYMEKKNLEKELKEVQKELKKEKKRIKLNNNTEVNR